MRHIILISGKDSLATALVQTARMPDLPYEFIFNDVEAELPETYEWLERVESKTGWNIRRVGRNLPELIKSYGGFLPSPTARYCTRECKIEPMEAEIGKEEATIYYGLRADENRIGYVPVGNKHIIPAYPLVDMGIDLQGVFAILEAQNLLPPDFFWGRLYEAVNSELEFYTNWEERLSWLYKRILFSGRSRANCFHCFFQSQYEFVWLLETHPELFQKAMEMEKDEYSFQPSYHLRDLLDEKKKQSVFNRRVKETVNVIKGGLQTSLYEVTTDNLLARTSCGLLCGK